jgi:sirohydrochlorin ferrochelatase
MRDPSIVLLDNGSLRPAAVLALRCAAAALMKRTGLAVAPVSLLHSHKIPDDELAGQSALIFEPWLRSRAEAGLREFLIVPYFLGPSRALTEYLLARVENLRGRWPDLDVRIADPLGVGGAESLGKLAAILEDRVRSELLRLTSAGERPAVAMVDHGSPEPKVAAVRNAVAADLRKRLGNAVRVVEPCSMERREGDKYAFTDPLLAALLDRPQFDHGSVIVPMFFLSPGRHAGPDGDVARICHEAEARHVNLHVTMTELLGGHPALLEMLADRLTAALRSSG